MLDNKRKIGLLGGSFNPPHEGHVHLSNVVWKLAELDEIWWLISPQNPLKSTHDLESFERRMNLCEEITQKYPHIKISDFEQKFATKYSYDTITLLQKNHPDIDFIWIIGADNLENFDKWQRWEDIFASIPIIVGDRKPYSQNALKSTAAKRFALHQIGENELTSITKNTPSWCYLHIDPIDISSTELRKL